VMQGNSMCEAGRERRPTATSIIAPLVF
jgi:hypothetical protein